MLKVAILVWLMLATVLAGVCIMVVLTVPSLMARDMNLIPIAAGIGAVIAIPFALYVAKRIVAIGSKHA